MGSFFRILMGVPLLRPLLRPLTRFLIGVIAIPTFRLFLKKVVRLDRLDAELEKDLEQWFRASLLLLVATRNMEESLFGWVDELWRGDYQWVMMGLRLLLAIGVIEKMPDQELFAIIHPGPPRLKFSKQYGYWRELREQFRPICRGLLCQHINRSSPVFAILAAIAPGWIGWTCYGMAITQYLVIGLVTSRDKALDALSEFDRQVAIRRRELIEEFDLQGQPAAVKEAAPAAKAAAGPQAADAAAPANPPAAKEFPAPSVANPPNAGYVSE